MRVKFAVEMYSAIFDQQLSGGYRLYEYVAKINICSQLEHTIARAYSKATTNPTNLVFIQSGRGSLVRQQAGRRRGVISSWLI
jgi:hypothetical protein